MVKIRSLFFTLLLIVMALILFFLLDLHHHPIWQATHLSGPEQLADFLRSFGAMTVLICLLLMVLQTLFTPLPLFLLAAANGFIFGLWYGILITMSGSLLGASLAFYLARGLGRGLISRCLKQTYMARVDQMSHQGGPWVVFMARLIPVIPSSIISYLAGLSKMNYKGFFVATAVGKLPEIIIYTALGHSFSQAEGMAMKVTILIILVTILAWPLLSRKIRNRVSTNRPPGC